MEANLQIFKNEDFGEVRTMVVDNEPWFIGRDICGVFGDKNHSRSIGRVDDIDKRIEEITDSMGRKQSAIFVNESGMYALLFAMQPQKAHHDGVSYEYPIEIQARIDKLHKFKRWVTHDVIPAIRKTGGYVANAQLFVDTYFCGVPDMQKQLVLGLMQNIEEQQNTIAKKDKQIEEQQPAVDYMNQVADASDSISIGQLSKIVSDEVIDLGRNRLFEYLRKKSIIMKTDTLPYQQYIDRGWFFVIQVTKSTPYGVKLIPQTRVTGKGQIAIVEMIRKDYGK